MAEKRRIEISLRKQAKLRGKIRKVYQEERTSMNEIRLRAFYAKLESLEQETKDTRCKRCGRSLSAEKSVIHGFGDVCFKQLFLAVPWVDFIELVKETKTITKRNIPGTYSEANIADSLSRVEIEMIETKIASRGKVSSPILRLLFPLEPGDPLPRSLPTCPSESQPVPAPSRCAQNQELSFKHYKRRGQTSSNSKVSTLNFGGESS